MKKILLTLFVGFVFGGAAIAQDATKATKKKLPAATSTSSPEYAAKVKAKEEKAKAYDATNSVPVAPVSPAQNSKAALVAPKSN